ncbi:MAG: nucleotide exchange factor GrpE [Terracidiphilus sp.]|jgi:molecular chaperone GrpE
MLNQEIEELKVKGFKEPASSATGAKIDPAAELPPPDETLAEAEAAGQTPAGGQTEIDQLKGERDQLLDRLARMQAEFENARRRAEREKVEFRDHVTGSVVEQFLPVLDNFELALKSTGSSQQLRSGVSLIMKQMEEILQKMQVSAIPAVGENFDPRVHEALGAVERDDVPDQHVAEEVRRGYKIRERLLRPALVRVAHNAKQTSE